MNGGGEFIGFYGSKGTMIIKDSTLTFKPEDTRPEPEAYSIYGWPAKLRDEYLKQFAADHPLPGVKEFKVDDDRRELCPASGIQRSFGAPGELL